MRQLVTELRLIGKLPEEAANSLAAVCRSIRLEKSIKEGKCWVLAECQTMDDLAEACLEFSVASVPLGNSLLIPTEEAKKETANFCWVYWAGGAEADELRWSIRSVMKNFAGTARITVIGDKPDWYTGHHIPAPRLGEQPYRRYRDTLNKLRILTTSPEIEDPRVWTMDDCYFLKPGFSLADFGFMSKLSRRYYSGGGEWEVMNTITQQQLAAAGYDIWHYATHCPQVIEPDKFKYIMERFDFGPTPLCWESLYGNVFYPESPVASTTQIRRVSFRPCTAIDGVRTKEESCVLNHAHKCWSAEFHAWLKRELPDSGFERPC